MALSNRDVKFRMYSSRWTILYRDLTTDAEGTMLSEDGQRATHREHLRNPQREGKAEANYQVGSGRLSSRATSQL